MEYRNEGREAVILSLYISYLAEICFWRTRYAACALMFRLEKNQIVSPDRYLPVFQEISDEEEACDFIDASDIIDEEHIEENDLSNS
ncbi:hypothetical protein AVEN_166721-1 [Araneus ventricosus]|uniref:Uncharacterized protein n=1 Tax=Araneus ventricosus TaxID=182803 RepID=A0A4Y2G152_ARAVE|nr:hypothetical protein AVEN_166721-1 [Araneus ventricosus]